MSKIFREPIKKTTVADGTYTSRSISFEDLLNGTCYIRFFDSDNVQVTPSAGTALFEVSEDGFSWADITNGSVDVTAGDYPRPGYVQGFVKLYRVTLTGITGASSFEANLIKNNV